MVFISHDLNVVRFISSEVAVMYLGSIMESGSTDEIYQKPYTLFKGTADAVPNIDPLKRKGAPAKR